MKRNVMIFRISVISSSVAARRLIRVPCVAGSPPFTAYGGASSARLILIDAVKRVDLVGILNRDDIIFKIEDMWAFFKGFCNFE